MKTPLSNFIPISRKLFAHEFWTEKRQYSKFEAWLDLLVTARFDNTEARMLVGGTVVRWNRGQLIASIRYLADRWGWSRHKVENFIKLLKAQDMIKMSIAAGTVQSIITISKYDTYNMVSNKASRQPGQYGASTKPAEGRYGDKTNIDNKEQKSKKRTIYRSFAHLVLFTDEFDKLAAASYTQNQIDAVLDAIENFKGNKKYTSLYLTAKKWLLKNAETTSATAANTGGRIVKIASAFEQALRHG